MRRRKFLASATAAVCPMVLGARARAAPVRPDDARTFATPADAPVPPRNAGLRRRRLRRDGRPQARLPGDGRRRPGVADLFAGRPPADDAERRGRTAPLRLERLRSCHGKRARRFLIVPGLLSGRIHIVDTVDPRRPKLHKVIEPEEVVAKAKLTGPHTVHCLADGNIMISMLGDANGNAPGGFLLLDDKFEVAGRWEASREGMNYNYDFWYQPRHNVMVSSEWAAPNTVRPGFKLDDVKAGKYGRQLHFWDWDDAADRPEHRPGRRRPDPAGGALPPQPGQHARVRRGRPCRAPCGTGSRTRPAALEGGEGDRGPRPRGQGLGLPRARADHRPRALAGRPLAVLLQLAARRRPAVRRQRPGEAQARRPGLARRRARQAPEVRGAELTGGPQMLQLSLDGKRLYVTNSLFSSWDNQFYPQIAKKGSYLLQVDCDTENGRPDASTKGSSSISAGSRTARPARTRCASPAAIRRRTSGSDP